MFTPARLAVARRQRLPCLAEVQTGNLREAGQTRVDAQPAQQRGGRHARVLHGDNGVSVGEKEGAIGRVAQRSANGWRERVDESVVARLEENNQSVEGLGVK